jgi:hypothetical protein
VKSNKTNQIGGNSESIYEGALYFSTTPLTFLGGSQTVAQKLMIVAATIQFQGNVRFTALDAASGLSPYTLRTALVY